MKKILFSLLATIVAVASYGQASLVATLSHEGSISTFYGATAFKEAMEKADHGDAITLSAGQFLATNINKNVIIRGAGMSVRNDSLYSHDVTYVQGDYEVNIPDSTTGRLNVEGINFKSAMKYKGIVSNPLFMKCRFGSITANEGTLSNSTFIHCRIADKIELSDNSSAQMINCMVCNPSNNDTSSSTFIFQNCTIMSTGTFNKVRNSSYLNCALLCHNEYVGAGYSSSAIPASNIVKYCIGCSGYGGTSASCNNIFVNITQTTTNITASSKKTLFKNGERDYLDEATWELTDDAKKHLGSDGTQRGMYGGNLPYEEDPTTPQITKCNVAAKSTADGKLSVDIEVKAAEY